MCDFQLLVRIIFPHFFSVNSEIWNVVIRIRDFSAENNFINVSWDIVIDIDFGDVSGNFSKLVFVSRGQCFENSDFLFMFV